MVRVTWFARTATALLVSGATAVALSALPASADTDVSVIAHRGSSGVTPENTGVAVDTAIEQGADFVEIDVQRTKDGKLVNFHDCTMERTTDVEEVFPDRPRYRVSDFTYAELRKLDAGSWFDEKYAGERIISVRDVVDRVKDKTGLLAEINPCEHYTGLADDLADELESIPGYIDDALAADQLAVQSFELDDATAFHGRLPDVPIGFLDASRPTAAELDALSEWADQVNTNTDITDEELIKEIQARGMESNVWTVDEPGRMRELIEFGVDGIITDYPQSLTQE